MVQIPENILKEMLDSLQQCDEFQKQIGDLTNDPQIQYLSGQTKSNIDRIGNYLGDELNKQTIQSDTYSENAAKFK